MIAVSCSTRARFPEAILKRTERKLAGPGRPGAVDKAGGQGGAPGGAAPYVTGRARCRCTARGGYVIPASKSASQALWRLPPLHPLARFARDWQTSDASRRENAEACPSFRGRASGPHKGRPMAANPESRCARRGAKHLWIPGSRRRGAPRNDGRGLFEIVKSEIRRGAQALRRPGECLGANAGRQRTTGSPTRCARSIRRRMRAARARRGSD